MTNDQKVINKIVLENPFAILITHSKDAINANHIPVELEGSAAPGCRLHGHMAQNNPQLDEIGNAGHILAIFMGPHKYISPTWYETPGVPTWNYIAIHCYGYGHIETNPDLALTKLERMTRRYEEDAWSLNMLTPEHRKKSLAGIVSFSIKIERVEAKFKLSQNKSIADRQSVYSQLKTMDDNDSKKMAELMEQYSEIKK